MVHRTARWHLLGLITAAVLPVWLFAAFLLVEYASRERSGFEQEAAQSAREASLVVEAELANLRGLLEALSKSAALAKGDLAGFQKEAQQIVAGSDRIVALSDLDGHQFFDTQSAYSAPQPDLAPLSGSERDRLKARMPLVSNVYARQPSNEYRISVAIPLQGPNGQTWLLAVSVPTAHIRDVLMPAVPAGWTLAVGDGQGNYVARSQMHEEVTGRPGLPEYLQKVIGRSGTFISRNFQGIALLAGYYRPPGSNWFYAANVPLWVVQAPLWRSLAAICLLGLLAMGISTALAYYVGKHFAGAAIALAARASALGQGKPVAPMSTRVTEFATIADALVAAERAIAERKHELETVLETAPAAVWFTYDPLALQVVRNRFAAELMGLAADRNSFGSPDKVVDTIAFKNGQPIGRQDRPLSRAMRGEQTDSEEFAYILPSGAKRFLLSSARPIRDPGGRVVGAVQISLDITDRKRTEEQRKLLLDELNHRVKNTLAVVQSIASQTLRSAADLKDADRKLSGRLISLSKAHDMLTREHWSGTDLKHLILSIVEPHAVSERFEIAGKPVWLPSNLALSFALALHELATNAIKYGALSVPAGIVSLTWSAKRNNGGIDLRVEWRERGGPTVRPGGRKGFGTRMLERVFDPKSSDKVTMRFDRAGVVCVFEAHLAAAEADPIEASEKVTQVDPAR
ncbi:sensor histidine kinase [Mesorhizobium sp. B1-1-8]|uniref:sensor histidine kinase n=1 Tax=Mesorhizobium sp. B1-1-8 TaxID=2589976 RepID=UPI001129E959|nr:HWE histidine kinase domain-containing protein [Mesorhizobium sp. B1-1-8]UCI10551.1 PAS domain-containing protein [Mesorhizobium sp. B1-1-8]